MKREKGFNKIMNRLFIGCGKPLIRVMQMLNVD